MSLGDGLVSEWLFEGNISNNVGSTQLKFSGASYREHMLNGVNLMLFGGGEIVGSGQLGNISESIGLYIPNDQTTNPIPTGIMNLFIESYYDRLNTKATMFIKGNAFEGATAGKTGYTPSLQPMNLYLFNDTTSTAINNYIGLFVHNDYSNNISLYTAGVLGAMGSGITFFVSGTMPIEQSATLFTHGF